VFLVAAVIAVINIILTSRIKIKNRQNEETVVS